jgi:hypothetical protein
MNSKNLVVVLALLLILSLGYIAYTGNKLNSPGPEAVRVEETTKAFAELQAQMQVMQKDIAANRANESSKEKTAKRKPPSFAEMAKRELANKQHIKLSFEQEAVDTAWSAMATSTIEKAFQLPELADGKLSTVDCRTTMCRLEISHDKTLELNKRTLFENYLLIRLAKELPIARIQHEDQPETGRTIGYFVRKGYKLPIKKIAAAE